MVSRLVRCGWVAPGALFFALQALPAAQVAMPKSAEELFQPTKIWTIQLTIARDQWEAMQPKPIPPNDPRERRNGVAGNLELDEVHADLEFEGTTFRDIGLRFKGNGTLLNSTGLRMPYKADLNQNVKGQKLAGLTTLNLHNGVWDPTNMNEALAYGLFRAVGVAAPRVTFARLYVTIPGLQARKYVGLYSIVEDIDRHFTADRFGNPDGVLFKPAAANFFTYHGPNWADYRREWDAKTEPMDAQKQRVIDFTAFAALATDAEFAAHVDTFFDVGNFARHMAVAVWVSNLDGPPFNGANVYLYLDSKTNRFVSIPWDEDDAWGGIFQSQDVRNTLNIYKPWGTPHSFISRVFQLEAFRKTYLATLAGIALDFGRSEKLIRQQQELGAMLRPAVTEDSETALGLFDGAISGTLVPRTFAGVAGAHGTHLTLREFTQARERSVIDQLLVGR